jgi:hypothetical protein
MLGLQLDAKQRAIRFAPHPAPEWDSLRVRRIMLGGAEVSLAMWTAPGLVRVLIVNSGPAFELTFRPPLPSGMLVTSAYMSGPGLAIAKHGRVGDEIHVSCPPGHTRILLELGASR